MRRPSDIAQEEQAVATLVELTGVFEGIASMRIAQIKNQVQQSTQFFHELWHIYSQLRVDGLFRYGRSQNENETVDKELYILITAEGGFSGDIDEKLINLMLESYNKDTHDIIVIGHHGAMQLAQAGVSFRKYFKLPVRDRNINAEPIIRFVQQYSSTRVFYQEYKSLMVQEVRQIELSAVVQEEGSTTGRGDDIISESNYIFEPSTYAVITHLERSMLHIAVSQLILDSKLAQYASRFRAMSSANERADDVRQELRLNYNRSKRALKDERLKEVINGLKKAKVRI